MKCPSCNNIDNFHYNYDWSKKVLEAKVILCNECGTFFKNENYGWTCQSCGLKYKVDITVTDDIWDKIRQSQNLLCGSCIMTRIEDFKEFSAFKLVKI